VIGAQSWSQSFEAAIVDDDELNALALANDLAVRGTVDNDDSWVVLSAQSSSPHRTVVHAAATGFVCNTPLG